MRSNKSKKSILPLVYPTSAISFSVDETDIIQGQLRSSTLILDVESMVDVNTHKFYILEHLIIGYMNSL